MLFRSPPVICFVSTTERRDQGDVEGEGAENGPIGRDNNEESQTTYDIVPRSEPAQAVDKKLEKVRKWLETLERPAEMADKEYKSFMRYCTEFFILEGKLWRKDPKRQHKIVISQHRRLFLISSAHDDVGHRGFYATNSLLSDRYWWPMQ